MTSHYIAAFVKDQRIKLSPLNPIDKGDFLEVFLLHGGNKT